MPGTRGYIARESGLKDIKNSVLVTFFDLVSHLNISHKIRYNDQKSWIDFDNKSRIVLLDAFYYPSDPNFDRLGSTEYTDGAIEEGINIAKKAQQILLSRTRYKHQEFNLVAKQLITCNPGDSWVKEDIVIPHFENRLPKQYAFIQASLDSNPNSNFVKDYKSTLDLMDDYDRARLLHGDWFAQPRTGGEFYKKFVEDRSVKELAYNPELPLHITFDFNVNPYMTCVVCQIEDNSTLNIIDEICLKTPRNTTKDTCKEFIHRYREHDAGLFIYGDPAGKHEDTRSEKGYNDYKIIQKELKAYHPSVRVAKKAPSIVMRGNFINAIFDDKIRGVNIFVDKSCTNVIADYNFVKEAMDGTKAKKKVKDKATEVSFEKYGHCSDSLDYLIITIFVIEYNKFKSAGDADIVRSIAPPRTRANAY